MLLNYNREGRIIALIAEKQRIIFNQLILSIIVIY